MSTRLEARAEVVKLARLLGVGEQELEFLAELPPGELRYLRELATDRLFGLSSRLLDRVSTGARIIPAPVAATIAQRAFGPLLCARVAGAVDTPRAVDVARRLPPDFLADTAVELDPRRAAAIIAAVPVDLVVSVARELGRRREYVTMGRFLAYLPDEGIRQSMAVLDDEALLRSAFVLEDKQRLDHAIGLLPPGRLEGALRRADELGLWAEALDMLDHLSPQRRETIARFVAGEPPTMLEAIVRAAVAYPESVPTLLALASDMTAEERSALVGVIDRSDRAVAEALADGFGDPEVAGPLLARLPGDLLAAVERAAERHGMQDVLARARAG